MKPRITQADIERGLRELGLGEGDIVLLHSSLSSFGDVDGGAQAVVQAFLDVLGETGTLAVPAFGELGTIPDTVRADPRAITSIHPLAAVSAIGQHAEALFRDHWQADTAHGEGTPYVRIAELGGYVCLAGVDQDRSTTLHTAEEMLRMPYLSDRTKTFETDSGTETRTYRFFPGPHRDFIGLDRLLRESGVMRIGRIGNSVIRLMPSQELIDVCRAAGRADPAFVLCDNPNCADCVAQRAALRRHRFGQEAFTLVASSGLAGRYVPEMLDHLKASGVNCVELDYVEGRPIDMLTGKEIQAVVGQLNDAACTVSALRSWSVPESPDKWLDRAAANGVGRVVLPLWAGAGRLAIEAAQRGLQLSVFNNVLGSADTSSFLVESAENGARLGFTFNAANFARAGEKPFLYSHKQKLRRFVDQLDVEDARFDGGVQPLARGNAEIKEMISILRCASFDGPMVLTSRNRGTGDLLSITQRFEALLDAM